MNGFVTAQSSRGVSKRVPMGYYDATADPVLLVVGEELRALRRVLRVREGRQSPEPHVLGRRQRRHHPRPGPSRHGASGRIRRDPDDLRSTRRRGRVVEVLHPRLRPADHVPNAGPTPSRAGRARAAARVQSIHRRSEEDVAPGLTQSILSRPPRRHTPGRVVHRCGRTERTAPCQPA